MFLFLSSRSTLRLHRVMELHKRLRSRLGSLAAASATVVPHEHAHQNGSCDALATCSNTNTNINRKKRQLPLPRTVQEFLSRDPEQVANDLDVPVTQVKELRVISAQEYLKAQSTVDLQYIRDVSTAQNALLLLSRDKADHHSRIMDDSEHHNDNITSLHHQPPPLFTGAVTALDYCIYQSCFSDMQQQERPNDPSSKPQRRSSSHVQALPVSASLVLSTGSTALNRLISSQPLQVGQLVCPWMDWLSSVVRNCKDSSTNSLGCNSSDLLKKCIIHGLEFGYVTEVEGESSTGKTQIALSLACYAATMARVDVTYLVSGGVSIISLARRASKIISSYRNALHVIVGTDDNNSAVIIDSLQRIQFIPVSDGFTVLATLTRLENEGETHAINKLSPTTFPRKLIVCDSAQGCLTTNLLGTHDKGGGVSAGSGFVSEVSMAFRRHARKTGNAVFITNGMVAASNKSGLPLTSSPYKNGLQPALGAEWRASDVRVYLNKIEDCALKRVQATLLHHYLKPVQKLHPPTVTFAISSEGIIDIPN